jgi:hypothetical protein
LFPDTEERLLGPLLKVFDKLVEGVVMVGKELVVDGRVGKWWRVGRLVVAIAAIVSIFVAGYLQKSCSHSGLTGYKRVSLGTQGSWSHCLLYARAACKPTCNDVVDGVDDSSINQFNCVFEGTGRRMD